MILSAVPVRSHMELQEQVDDLLATINHNGYHLRDFLEPEEIAECITKENYREAMDSALYVVGSELSEKVRDGWRELCTVGDSPGRLVAAEQRVLTLSGELSRARDALNAIARSTKSKAILSIISSYRSKTA